VWRTMQVTSVPSSLGLLIQGAGIMLLALLCLFLARSVRRVFMTYWAVAWACLAVGLASLAVSFHSPRMAVWVESWYYLGEYAFGLFLIAGFRNLRTDERLQRSDAWVLPPALLLAALLPRLAESFSIRFIPQAAFMAALFAGAFVQVERLRRSRGSSAGMRLVSVALAVLTLNFLHYPPVLYYASISGVGLPIAYSGYTSIYDLIMEVLLGFGMVTLVMEESRREVEAANRELIAARDRLEAVARVDPLTQSLNRHAFYSLVEEKRDPGGGPPRGCAVVLDIDDLKVINDSYGHASGDTAIRAVASAVRSLIRADDLLFRWGGDEFLTILLNVSEEEATRRLAGLDSLLAQVVVPGSTQPIRVCVSFGVAAFSEERPLEKAIEVADGAMYSSKQQTKVRGLSLPGPREVP
jgi:diguanylate cyclase (GGDEF)-like protein